MLNKYKDENDYELLYMVSENNDEDAKKIFFEKYDNIIRMKASKYSKFVSSKGFDFNDLFQEGRLGLTQAINDYKNQKNVKFYTFANLCIDRQIASFLRNIAREKHQVLNNSISLDSTTNTIGRPITELILDDKNIDPEVSFIEMEEKEELFSKIDKVLSNSERDVFNLRLQGFTYKEISQLLNITEKSVDGSMRRIKMKIKNIIEKNK
jgi:RNA polymerase sporulation-specific sigma factor